VSVETAQAVQIEEAPARVDFAEAVETHVAAPPAAAFEAALAVSVREMRLSSILLLLRGLPSIVARRRLPRLGSTRPFWDQLLREPGFVRLFEDARECHGAFGYVGQPWTPSGGGAKLEDPGAFAAFDEPGYAKVVMELRAKPAPGGSLLWTETRIQLTDEHARRAFRRYWLLVRLGSNAIRKDWFRAARRRAER
jgi:hypothetical protein